MRTRVNPECMFFQNFRGELFENGKRYAKSETTIQKALEERIPNHNFLHIQHVQFERKTSVSQSNLLYPWYVYNYQTRAPRGTDRSPEYNEHFCYKLDSRVKNLTTEWNQKQQHFITHASGSLLWIWLVAVAFRSEEEVFWRRGTPPPGDLFCLALVPPLGKYGQNIFMHVPGHEHFIPTKFRKHPLSGSVVKAGYVFPYIHVHMH